MKEKSRIVAAALAFFGGSLGIHKFYLNNFGLGFFYIFLTMVIFSGIKFPITMILGMIDSMKILSMSDSQFDEKYNKNQKSRSGDRIERQNRNASQGQNAMDLERKRYNYKKTSKQRNNPFIISGKKKYEDYDLEGAADDFNEALSLSRDDSELHFLLAAVYSLLEKKDKSFYHLEESVKLGYKDYENIKTYDDLAYLRIQPEFDAFQKAGYKTTDIKGIAAPKRDLLQDDLLLTQLNRLKKMRDKGLLSEKEYVIEKEKLQQR